jgi:nucleoid DNA-binding protein
MTKAELIEKLARSRDLPPDVTKKCIGQILDLAFEELGAYFVRAKVTRSQCPRFTFPGFGTFTKKKRSARQGVNPRTLEPMTIDAAYTIDFRPGTELKNHLNPRAAAPTKPVAAKPGKRGGQLELSVVAEVEPPAPTRLARILAEDDDDDSVSIQRRRFTHRDDLDDDLEDVESGDLDEVASDERLELPPAPMQRARVRGGAATRTGS